MSMIPRAHLVLEKKDGKLHIGIFSEGSPTVMRGGRTMELLRGYGHSFAEGTANLLRDISGRLMNDPAWAQFRNALADIVKSGGTQHPQVSVGSLEDESKDPQAYLILTYAGGAMQVGIYDKAQVAKLVELGVSGLPVMWHGDTFEAGRAKILDHIAKALARYRSAAAEAVNFGAAFDALIASGGTSVVPVQISDDLRTMIESEVAKEAKDPKAPAQKNPGIPWGYGGGLWGGGSWPISGGTCGGTGLCGFGPSCGYWPVATTCLANYWITPGWNYGLLNAMPVAVGSTFMTPLVGAEQDPSYADLVLRAMEWWIESGRSGAAPDDHSALLGMAPRSLAARTNIVLTYALAHPDQAPIDSVKQVLCAGGKCAPAQATAQDYEVVESHFTPTKQAVVLDVRDPEEVKAAGWMGRPGPVAIPLAQLATRIDELVAATQGDWNVDIHVEPAGVRSDRAIEFLRGLGFNASENRRAVPGTARTVSEPQPLGAAR